MEDDWIPMQQRFDELLLKEWQARFGVAEDNAYLCMWYACVMEFRPHAAISVGLISNKALSKLQSVCKMNVELDQYNFSLVLEKLSTKIADYSYSGNKWRILFWESNHGVIYDYSPSMPAQECLLAPIQYALKDKYVFVIVPRYIY